MVETEQLIQELSRQAPPVKLVPPRRWALRLLAVLVAYGAAMLWMIGPRPDLSVQLARPMFVGEIMLLAAALLSAAMASILAMYPDMLQKRGLLKLPYILAMLVIAMQAYQLGAPHDARMVVAAPAAHSMECTCFIALSALLPAALIFLLLKKGATLAPLNAGALAIITATALGALTLRLSEANDAIPHLLVWHYAPMIAFAALGAGLGRMLLKW